MGLVHEARDDLDMEQANAMRWQAYHVALWQRAKKMPPWSRVLLRRRERQDPDQMRMAALAWTRFMGGRVLKRRMHDGG